MAEHKVPDLPYAYNALEPYIDEETMKIHHDKHHAAYVKNLNDALKKHPELADKPVNGLLADLSSLPEDIRTAVRNHGGGHVNHSLFWTVLKKDVEFSGEVAEAIKAKFGSFEKFKEEFSNAAVTVFGSGWAWLVVNNGELEVTKTPNQDSPVSEGKIPLLCLDVWEHSYYKKYEWRRNEYIEAFFNVIKWEQVNENFKKSKEQ